jgi:diguanylate cyclase (GGDEF)-like protein
MAALLLVADADPFNLRLLSEVCESSGYSVVTAADGGAVLDAVARERPDLVLMDVSLPVMDGLAVMQILKADANLSHIPILLVTAEDDVHSRQQGIALGAEDYIGKPYRVFEVQQRVRNALRIAARGNSSPSIEPPSNPDVMDVVTGAGTKSQLHFSLDYEFTRAVRYGHPLSCIVVRFSNYNEVMQSLGNDATAAVLAQLAGGLRQCIRGIDHLFRSNRDEFALLLPETDQGGCEIVAGRVARAGADGSLVGARVEPMPLVQVGRASYPALKPRDGDELYKAARAQMKA